ncbi:unnamed protein product [Rangifer tarandus platyrhynchus]|uniref:Uncharacterized protein n=1 Tax=Rangifer tarandus platyrhynchus TaxID=3082113 RepID=A0ABN8XP75_RANTA|nr:unnamed protein product [Rangifer tarandus platyrhynchus]CAI9689567.1 unnamed protein product [Rangifer tarandus platyrhynchus]
MAAGLEAAAEQEGWRPDGLASGRGAAGAVTAPCAPAPRLRRPAPRALGPAASSSFGRATQRRPPPQRLITAAG